MLSKLLDPVDLTSHLIKFKICLTFSLCFYAQNEPTFLQNLFHAVLNNQINKKEPPKKKPKAVKVRGGVEGRNDRGQRFNVFF